MGQDLGRGGGVGGVSLGSGPMQPEKALGAGPRQAMFKFRVGPLLRTRPEAERQHVQRATSGVWSSVEFWSLEVRPWVRGVWVGFRPSAVGGGLRGGLRV